MNPRRSPFISKATFLLSAGLCMFGFSQPSKAVCPEKPTVWMDERTAASHLLAKRDVELPASLTWVKEVQKVVLAVTVDRKGKICALKPVAGPAALTKVAAKAVKQHWRYRPFLVDWKPVVVQFPVTVRFVPSKHEEPRWIIACQLCPASVSAPGA